MQSLTSDQARWLEHARLGYTPFEVYCGHCRYALAEPGPGCCRYVAPSEPARSLWRRLLSRKETP